MKKAIAALPFLIAMGDAGTALAYESDTRELGRAPGATDYYRLTCTAGDTDRLNFKLTDTTPPPPDAQLLNMQVAKAGLLGEASAITPGKSKTVTLQGGDGSYKIAIDTFGTTRGGKQAFTLGAQCLNAAGQPTKASVTEKSGTLKNNKKKRYAVKCSKKKTTGNTDTLSVRLTNTTKAGAILAAQLVKARGAINTTDGNEINAQYGSGDYYLTIDHTGTDPSRDNSKLYTFQANCLNSANAVTGEPIVLQLQDQ